MTHRRTVRELWRVSPGMVFERSASADTVSVHLVLESGVWIGVAAFAASLEVCLLDFIAGRAGRPRLVAIHAKRVAFFAALFWFWYIVPIVAGIP